MPKDEHFTTVHYIDKLFTRNLNGPHIRKCQENWDYFTCTNLTNNLVLVSIVNKSIH